MTDDDWIVPAWRGSPRVTALFTTRRIGVPSDGLRARLPSDPVWLAQAHGRAVATIDRQNAEALRATPPRADAAVTRTPGIALTVCTADCLPVLLGDLAGTVVGVAHAGWRGLAAGVLDATVAALGVPGQEIAAWIGPGIGPKAFEVGADVRDAYCDPDPGCAAHFTPLRERKWLADLAGLARRRLSAVGVTRVDGGDWCTHTDSVRFLSYRRDGSSGRMALVAWLA